MLKGKELETDSQNFQEFELGKSEKLIIKNKTPNLSQDLESILEKAGNQHRFQYITLLVISGLGMFYSMCWFNLPYVFLKPDYLCKQSDGTFSVCTEEVACADKMIYQLSDSKYFY